MGLVGLLEGLHEGHQVRAEGIADLAKLDEIEATLPALILGHERLIHTQTTRKVDLTEVAAQPEVTQLLAQPLMLSGEDGLLHGDSRSHQPRQPNSGYGAMVRLVIKGGETPGDPCPEGHPNRSGMAFCTTCGTALPNSASTADASARSQRTVTERKRSVTMAIGALLALAVVAGGAFALGRQSDDDPPTTTAPVATSTEAPPTSTTIAPPPTTAAVLSLDEAEAARSAAVVYFTYGVTAEGYPAFEEIISPSAAPSLKSMIIGADYRNAGCSQIVESIQEDPLPNQPTYGWALSLRYQCPDGPPTSSIDGTPLPMTDDIYVEVTVAPSPSGGYWATQVQIVDNN